MFKISHETILRDFITKVQTSALPYDEKHSIVSMCRFPEVRLAYPRLGCYHITHPQSAWTRIVFYMQNGVNVRNPRCLCCGSVLAFDLENCKYIDNIHKCHNTCILNTSHSVVDITDTTDYIPNFSKRKRMMRCFQQCFEDKSVVSMR